MKTLHRRYAGIDVHSANGVACIRVMTKGKVQHEVRRFSASTRDLFALRDWFEVEKVTKQRDISSAFKRRWRTHRGFNLSPRGDIRRSESGVLSWLKLRKEPIRAIILSQKRSSRCPEEVELGHPCRCLAHPWNMGGHAIGIIDRPRGSQPSTLRGPNGT
jgi:hypothetical protein